MGSTLHIDVDAIIGLQPPPRLAETKPYHAGQLIDFADADYVLFRVLALADVQREAMFHLQQLTEKYLKSIILASGLQYQRKHGLPYLLGLAASCHAVLGDRSMALFCDRLDPYQKWGHYPEMTLDQTYLTANWNRYERYGLSEADLVAATLREVAAAALDAAPYEISAGSRPSLLEEVVHRDSVLGRHLEEHQLRAESCLREMFLAENLFFTPEHLPTFHQSFHEDKRYPLIPLPREHPTFWSRYGLTPP